MIVIRNEFTAYCPDCAWHYSTGEEMLRDHAAKWHRCLPPVPSQREQVTA